MPVLNGLYRPLGTASAAFITVLAELISIQSQLIDGALVHLPGCYRAVEYTQELIGEASQAGLALLFSLKHDFPSEWHKFVTIGNFKATIKKDFFPYFAQSKKFTITLEPIRLYAIKDEKIESAGAATLDPATLSTNLNSEEKFEINLTPNSVLERKPEALVFLLIHFFLA